MPLPFLFPYLHSTIIEYGASFLIVYLLFKCIRNMFYGSENRPPPCLPSIPIFGSLPFISTPAAIHVHFMNKAKELGDVIAFYMCGRYVVVLNGRQTIKDAFTRQSLAFASRPTFYLTEIINPRQTGIIEHEFNEHFRIHRRLTVSVLKTFGFEESTMETRITTEIEDLIRRLKLLNGQAFNPEFELTAAVSNVISGIIFGKAWSKEDPEFHEGLDIMFKMARGSSKSFMINFFPILRFVPTFKQVMNDIIKTEKGWREYLERIVRKMSEDENMNNFYVLYQNEMNKLRASSEDSNVEKCEIVDEDQLLNTIRDLFFAGTETTTTTLQWMVYTMANNPDVQRQIWEELDRVVGSERLPRWEDRKNLPLTEAAILEVMRYRTLVPMAMAHTTTRNCVINGYFIPKGVMVMPNIYSTHMDPDEWTEPEKFMIERFLNDDRKQVINSDRIIPFSLGKRSCLGEPLARQEIFLFTAALLLYFKIQPPEGESKISAEERPGGLSIHPSPFEVKITSRY